MIRALRELGIMLVAALILMAVAGVTLALSPALLLLNWLEERRGNCFKPEIMG